MKVLVTGATGFVGNHLISTLLQDKNITVIATARNVEKAMSCDWYRKTKFIPYDLQDESEKNLYNFFDQPDIVIHLAWDGLPNYKDLIHIEKNLFNNYSFVKNLVSNGLKNITITGTCFEYGMQDGCLKEDIQTTPSNPYAIAKDSLRKFVEELNKQFEFDYKWIRLFYMYGKGQNQKSLPALLDSAISSGEKEFNMSGGEQLRDYLPIDQVTQYIYKIATQNKITNQVINCCSGKPISIRKFVENYLEDKNYQMKLNLGFYPYTDYEPMAFWGDSNKLNQVLNEQM